MSINNKIFLLSLLGIILLLFINFSSNIDNNSSKRNISSSQGINENIFSRSDSTPQWAMLGGNPQHTGTSPYDTSDNPGGVKWYYYSMEGVEATPAIDSDGTIYVGSMDFYMYAISNDGELKWKYATGADIWSSAAIGLDGTIYFGSKDNYLYALNPDGTQKWKFKTGDGIVSSPCIDQNGTIYFGSTDEYLYSLNPHGLLRWKFYIKGGISSSPAVSPDGTVYVGSHYGTLYAINKMGIIKWKFGVAFDNIHSSPAIGPDGTIYYCSDYYNFYAVNEDGELKWKLELGIQLDSSPAIGIDGTIYIGSHYGSINNTPTFYVYAINPNGTIMWKYGTGSQIASSATIGSDGTIFIGSSGHLFALNPNGTLRWKKEISIGESSPSICSDGTIYVGSYGRGVYAINKGPPLPPENGLMVYDRSRGRIKFTWDPPSDDNGSPLIAYNIYRGSNPEEMTLLATVDASTTHFTDKSIKPGSTYHYDVTSVNEVGESEMRSSWSIETDDIATDRPAIRTICSYLFVSFLILAIFIVFVLLRGKKK